jgi:DNA topoisomerase-1
MADAETEKTIIRINISGQSHEFIATGEIVVFDGFLRVYKESFDDDTAEQEEYGTIIPPVTTGQTLEFAEITATERYTQQPSRYNEATLVRKLEELGIGRPSTYAPTISTIQQREYVERGDKKGTERSYSIITLASNGKMSETVKTEMAGSEKSKIIPTDIGVVVTDFLCQHFPEIMDYNFTANVEKEFDDIAEGDKEWQNMLKDFYTKFEPMIEQSLNDRAESKVGERKLGTDPASGRIVAVKIGRFGPMVQIGTPNDEEKPKFAQLKKGQSIATITLEEALDLFKLPMTLGEYEGLTVTIGTGRFGPYVLHNGKYVSIPKGIDPFNIDLQQAIELIQEKMSAEQQKHIKKFEEHPDLELLNGRYGAYICYKGTNYRLPKSVNDPKDLTVEQCMDIIKAQDSKPKKAKSRG